MNKILNWKFIYFVAVDVLLVNLSYIAAFFFAYDLLAVYDYYYINAIVVTCIHIACFYYFKLYKSLWTYAGINEIFLSSGGCITGGILSLVYLKLLQPAVPYTVCFLSVIFNLLLILAFRFSFRIYRQLAGSFGRCEKRDLKRVLIVGAGSAGIMIINEMKCHPELNYLPVGLIDDDKRKIGKMVSGIKVLGDREHIDSFVQQFSVDEIIIAIPSLTGDSRTALVNICHRTGCRVKTLPGLYELIEGKKTLMQIRDVDVSDLLGRESIHLDVCGISEYIRGKTVLVTGGGGSIGSEICKQIMRYNPKLLLILDIYENNVYDICNELKLYYNNPPVKAIIASITDINIIKDVFMEYRPDVVFHAAAHKHVPMMEENPIEAVKNNVFGTLNVAECANMSGCKKFVMISTDKAVNPTNVMGATKRICEMIIQTMGTHSFTEFVAVRFGNVLGSNGSVIPFFKKQIANGGPVTVTDENVTRYFMTVQEAVQLVLQAGVFAQGGEIFVLDMGKPVRIYDLACDLIKLSGLVLDRDIKIRITGLRPGEKLYEELLMAEEGLKRTGHDLIYIGNPIPINSEKFMKGLSELKDIVDKGKKHELYKKLEELVPTYKREVHEYLYAGHVETAMTAGSQN